MTSTARTAARRNDRPGTTACATAVSNHNAHAATLRNSNGLAPRCAYRGAVGASTSRTAHQLAKALVVVSASRPARRKSLPTCARPRDDLFGSEWALGVVRKAERCVDFHEWRALQGGVELAGLQQ